MNDEAPAILSQIDSAILTITLNRPQKMNALNGDMLLALYDAMLAGENNPAVRAIILTGAGRGFCSGQDLNLRRHSDPSQEQKPFDIGHAIDTYYNPLVRLMANMATPIIGVVNGIAAGAGANLALSCDIVLAAHSASFIQAFAKIGLVPDAGGSWSLVQHLGLARAKGLALLANELSAEKAAEWGLIWQAVPDAELYDTAKAMAQKLVQGPPKCHGLIKQVLLAGTTNTLHQQLELEKDKQQEAGNGGEYKEGIRAFFEKRKPNY